MQGDTYNTDRGEAIVNPCELTASVTALANAMASRMSEDELNLVGVILTQLGDTLITIATHRGVCGGQSK